MQSLHANVHWLVLCTLIGDWSLWRDLNLLVTADVTSNVTNWKGKYVLCSMNMSGINEIRMSLQWRYGSSTWLYGIVGTEVIGHLDTFQFSPTVFRILNNMEVEIFKYSNCLHVAVIVRKRDLWEQLVNQYWLGGIEVGFLELKFECLFLANSGRSHLLSTSQISNTEQAFFPAAWVLQLIVVSVCERERGENRVYQGAHSQDDR